MSQENFAFTVQSSDPSANLTLAVWINDVCCLPPTAITQPLTVSHAIDDETERPHKVRLEMTGKTDLHTVIDSQGHIVKDALLQFHNFTLADITVDSVMYLYAKYTHNHNGHSNSVTQPFNMSMGCNGTVEFEFSTPMYLWLLEHLV